MSSTYYVKLIVGVIVSRDCISEKKTECSCGQQFIPGHKYCFACGEKTEDEEGLLIAKKYLKVFGEGYKVDDLVAVNRDRDEDQFVLGMILAQTNSSEKDQFRGISLAQLPPQLKTVEAQLKKHYPEFSTYDINLHLVGYWS